MTVIELSDEQATALRVRAAAQGLSLEDWLKQLAVDPSAAPGGVQTAATLVLETMRDVPCDAPNELPKDGASQHDHYLYGWPKQEA